jgi:glycosyltransferase involved in cell wall biosynthesis
MMVCRSTNGEPVATPNARMPLVSVILPTHNRAKLVTRAVYSVLGQTYRHLELIVVDDASTDGTPQALAAIEDPRVRVLRNEVNRGASATRNAGIRSARGELIAFHDDDDIWFAQKLEKQVQALQAASAETGWCLCGFVRRRPSGCDYVGGRRLYEQLDFRQGANRTLRDGGQDWSLIATPGWLLKRDALERAGPFDERIRSWDDWELGIRLEKSCKRIFVDEPLFLQDLSSGGGLTRAERARARDLRIIMDKHGDLWRDRPRVAARHWYLIGRIENRHEGGAAGRDALLRSLKLQPFSIRTWRALALSHLSRRSNQSLWRLWRRTLKTVPARPRASQPKGDPS